MVKWVSEEPMKQDEYILTFDAAEDENHLRKCTFVPSAELQTCSLRVLEMFRGKSPMYAIMTDDGINMIELLKKIRTAIAGFGGSSGGGNSAGWDYSTETKVH